MGKYLTLFSSHTSYDEYINGPDAILPNISYCEDVKDVHFNPEQPHDYSKDCLTFNIISGGTIYWTASDTAYTKTISYSKDNGNTWTDITSNTGSSTPSISVNEGDIVQFRGDNATYSSDFSMYNTFSGSTAKFNTEGNIMSLIDSTGFVTATTLTDANTFFNLFADCTGLISAENLVLPATTLAEGCYGLMFDGCSSLTTAPELPATTLIDYCYLAMFQNCTSLNYIKCLATDISANHCITNWVYNVALSGTFVKNQNMASWTTGIDGIPRKWTVQDAS